MSRFGSELDQIVNLESESKKIYTDLMDTVQKTLSRRDVLKLLVRAKQAPLRANQV